MMLTGWYEEPMDETIRLCLRLESLFDQYKHHMLTPDVNASHQAIVALLRLLALTDRRDLKGKLSAHMMQQVTSMMQLRANPHVDSQRLDSLILQMEEDLQALREVSKRFGESVRQNKLLNHVRAQLQSPAGIAVMSVPQYALWLRQPETWRVDCLTQWMAEFKLLSRMVSRLLTILRQSAVPRQGQAQRGCYEQAVDPTQPCSLLRVQLLDDQRDIYPVMSVGKHRAVLQFHKVCDLAQGIAQKSYDDIVFNIALCRL